MIENLKIALLKQKKLIAIFLLTIFLPSIALSIFGIRAIRNERFRLVEQIENEHKRTAESLKNQVKKQFDDIKATLQSLTQQFSFLRKNHQEIKELIDARLTPNQLIEQVFIQFGGDKPFFPLFQPVLKKPAATASTFLHESQRELLIRAEHNEFVQKNYKNAILLYREIISLSRDKNVKAQMLNSIARNYKNMRSFRSAIREYQNISRNYPESVTSSGLSLDLISKLQIIKCYQRLKNFQNSIKSALGLYSNILKNPWHLSEDQFKMYVNMVD